MTLPTAQDIETLSIAMAASVGHHWQAMGDEQASQFRIMANACLIRLAMTGREESLPREHLVAIFADVDHVLGAAAVMIERDDPKDPIVAKLYRNRASVRTMADVILDDGTVEEVV